MTRPTDYSQLDYILAKRGPFERLSEAARHGHLPTLYARPLPFPTTGEAAITEIKRLTKEMAELVAENFRLKAKIGEMKINRPIDPEIFVPRDGFQVKDLMQLAAVVTAIPVAAMVSAARARHVAYPRHLAIWLIREVRWDLSLPQIGHQFGNRDHTTIMHALKNVAKLRDAAPFKDWMADERIQGAIAAAKEKGGAS